MQLSTVLLTACLLGVAAGSLDDDAQWVREEDISEKMWSRLRLEALESFPLYP